MFGGLAKLRGDAASVANGSGDGYHLIVLYEHTLHIFQSSRRCRCCTVSASSINIPQPPPPSPSSTPASRAMYRPRHASSQLPSPHELSFQPWQQLPLESLTHVWLPYQTHGLTVATRRNDVILQWADLETGWMSFSHNQSRGEFLDYLHRQDYTLAIDHLDLDDVASPHSTIVGRNWSFLTPNYSLNPLPQTTADTPVPPSPPAAAPSDNTGLTYEDRHSSAYEASLLTLYMHLPTASTTTGSSSSSTVLPHHEHTLDIRGLQVALTYQVKHGLALALEGNVMGMSLLSMVVEGAICLDWGDLHALGLVGVALAECRGGQRFTAAMANIETSFRLSWESGHDVGCFVASVAQYDVQCAQLAWDAAYASLKKAQRFAPPKHKPLMHSKLQALHDRVQGKDSTAVPTGWRRVLSPRRSSNDLVISTSSKPPISNLTSVVLDDLAVSDLTYYMPNPTVLVKVTPHRQYRLSYHRHWTVHTLLSHVICRHERRTVQDMTSQLFCIVGLDIDPSQQHDQVLALHQSMASVMDSSTPVRFKAILADRPAVVAVRVYFCC
ncbi:hypothetical protein, variant [Aphanomyces astaci]|uniref:Uncharacterized protein n=1 Tax=Aphanomyces astaci TaxID=112090 RepID=W4G3X1_APHAT|nr:hypothetical protein, variant [Aphanomyces astaci]ETV73981.1 hypothetical protein, variant [Aphanomyces astaci]|eukprot:XP_009836493.1 hypothetical protein, variant [Aphanomyces astaci]